MVERIEATRRQFSMRGMLALLTIICVIAWATNTLLQRGGVDATQVALMVLLGTILGSLFALFLGGTRDVTLLGGVAGSVTVWLTICAGMPELRSGVFSGPPLTAMTILGILGLSLLFFPGVAVGSLVWRLFRDSDSS